MVRWWEIEDSTSPSTPCIRAIAYYRHSAQDRQENSIPIQREQVRQWADENSVEIIREFSDAGKSGLNAEGRPAFNEMMNEWLRQRTDFDYILCLDATAMSTRCARLSRISIIRSSSPRMLKRAP